MFAAVAPQTSTGWLPVALAVLAAVGGVGGLVTILNLPKLRKKMDADAADVLTGAAIGLVEPLRAQVEALSGQVARLEADKASQSVLLIAHQLWDEMVWSLAQQESLPVPKPPPLRAQ